MTCKTDPSPAQRIDFADLLVATVAGFALALTALSLSIQPIVGNLAGSRDFVSYWATGHQLVHHANPYNRDAISAIEHAAGLDASAVLMMRNPPWALPLAWLLGFLGLREATTLWSLLLFACLLVSVRIIRELYGSPPNRLHWLALSFTPALLCLTMGQTALLSLLGLVLFLRWHRSRPFAAGASLWLCALKPHLFLPFAAALAAWIVVARAWKLVTGTAAALALSSAVATLIDPRAWPDYIHLMRSPAVENDFIPAWQAQFDNGQLPTPSGFSTCPPRSVAYGPSSTSGASAPRGTGRRTPACSCWSLSSPPPTAGFTISASPSQPSLRAPASRAQGSSWPSWLLPFLSWMSKSVLFSSSRLSASSTSGPPRRGSSGTSLQPCMSPNQAADPLTC